MCPHGRKDPLQCFQCKGAANAHPKPVRKPRKFREKHASREEQYARYIDCGPQNWDDR
jgi:hypothetical protein